MVRTDMNRMIFGAPRTARAPWRNIERVEPDRIRDDESSIWNLLQRRRPVRRTVQQMYESADACCLRRKDNAVACDARLSVC
jgi:hypothetical protein